MSFLRWAIRVFGKWLWILGFVPLVLDYINIYIPTNLLPQAIRMFISNGANWTLTGGLFILGFLISAYLVHEDTKKELQSRITELEIHHSKMLAEDINENSVDLSHFSTSAYNAIELKYVVGNEPIKLSYIALRYVDTDGQQKERHIEQYYSLSDNLLTGHAVHSNVLNLGEGVRFHAVARNDTRNETVVIKVCFAGFKSGKVVEFEREIRLKPNQAWLVS